MPNYAIQRLSRRQFQTKISRTAPLVTARHEPKVTVNYPDSYGDYAVVYGDIGWVYRCVARIAQTAASVPLRTVKLVREGDEVREEDAGGTAMAQVLEYANEFSTWPDLIEATAAYLNITGNAYWELDRGKTSGEPRELWCLRPDRVRIKPDKERYIGGYQYTVDHKNKMQFEPEDVVHFKFFHPSDDFYGLGPLKVSVPAVIMEYYGTAYNRVMLQRFGWPTGMVQTDVNVVPPEEEIRLKRSFEEQFVGPTNAGKLMFLPQGVTMTASGMSPDDMQWVETRKMTREDIAATFGVPPIMMGLYEGVNFATAQQQEKMFWSAAVKPTLEKIAGAINEFFCPQFQEQDLRVRFDLSGVECLQADKGKETERILAIVRELRLTPNMGLHMLQQAGLVSGIEGDIPGGDEVLVPMNLVPLEAVGEGEPEPEEEEAEKRYDDDNGRSSFDTIRDWYDATPAPVEA